MRRMMWGKTVVLMVFASSFLFVSGAQTCNPVDAKTSASFRITGGQACATTASLNWKYTENNGTLTIRWGTSTAYGFSKSVYTSNPIQLTNLKPGTTYYYAVDATWKGSSNYHYVRWKFTTAGGTTANSYVCQERDREQFVITLGNTPHVFPINGKNGISIALYTPNGSKVFSRTLQSGRLGKNNVETIKNIMPGIYMLKAKASGTTIAQKVLIGN